MRITNYTTATAVLLALLMAPASAAAQTPLSFSWQLQPFCNVLTVRVAADNGVFRLDGFDDQCGAPQRAPAVGVATINRDGSIGIGMHLVAAPSGRALSLDARLDPGTGQGTWRDSAGNSGRLAPGASTGGAPRPLPTLPATAIATGSITAAHLAPGLIGTVAQARVGGLCTNGQALRGVNPDGTVACTNVAATIDPAATNFGHYSAIAIGADDLPIVAAYDVTEQRLKVMHCGDSACITGNRVVPVTPDGIAWGGHGSIAIGRDGLPILAFADGESTWLQVLHCGTVDCSQGNVTTAARSATEQGGGLYTDIAIGADGLAVISHYSGTGRLLVTHCGNVLCTANTTTVADTTADRVGEFTSLAIGADGLPVVSHRNRTTDRLRVTHCGNVACTAGTVSNDIAESSLAEHTAIVVGLDGLPIIAVSQGKLGLRMTHCGNAACSSGNVSTLVTRPELVAGHYPSVTIGTTGRPIVSHYGAEANALLVTQCADLACTTGATTRVDSLDQRHGTWSSIAIGRDGLPIVSHYVTVAGALRVTKCGTATCQ